MNVTDEHARQREELTDTLQGRKRLGEEPEKKERATSSIVPSFVDSYSG